MNKPHVHAEVIKAWADGAEVNFNTTNENRDNPKNLFTRCVEWLDSDVQYSHTN